ncbi:MAG: UDP-N-acetylmuramoyl-tripeptide--D-alanyl-D-alanine ligase [Verrucomicrobiae bacterium]|nr:UDP-N-acetylmuramoyl-tripeptide--D-alanyl-D-alanine ligase [Verrucomicrobiae bacterium]
MRVMKLSELIEVWDDAFLLSGRNVSSATQVLGVNTDSRRVIKGDCFFALKGERYDAHDFIEEVIARGAVTAVVERDVKTLKEFPLIRVDNTVLALQQLASFYRDSLKIPIVAVAGSNGKTSTKELIAAALSSRWNAAKTLGNLNNHLGVPLTLLGIDPEHEAAVVELGTNHPGEIAFLTKLVKPTVGVITNIGLEHLEFFKDEAGVAKEEGALLEGMENQAIAILNADDSWTESLRGRAKGKVLTAGFSESADVRVSKLEQNDKGQSFCVTFQDDEKIFELPLVGRHLAGNAALAIATGLSLDFSLAEMAEGLKRVSLPSGRMKVYVAKGGGKVIDDSYNANPSSMKAALHYLAGLSGRRIAVLGDMGELGEEASQWHRYVGREAAQLPLDLVVAIGREAGNYAQGTAGKIKVETFVGVEEAVDFLKKNVGSNDVILVKASRSARLERVVEALVGSVTERDHSC